MHNNTFGPTEARTFLQNLAYSDSKVRLKQAVFRENMEGTADKFVGVLTIEIRQSNLNRQVVAIRVYGPRKNFQSVAIRHINGESLHTIFEDITPGDAPPDTTPFRIGGAQIVYCSPTDPYVIALEILDDYSHSYMQGKSLRGYQTPHPITGGTVGSFLKSINQEFATTGANWKIGAPQVVNNAKAAAWGSIGQVQPQKRPKSLVNALSPSQTPEPKKVMDVGSMFLSPRKRITITKPEPQN